MTEAELVLEVGSNIERAWGMIQWWVSVSFAVLLAAHLGMKYLNAVFVSIIVLMYSLFSFLVAQVFLSYMRFTFASVSALEMLSEQEKLSALSLHILGDNSSLLGTTLWLTLLITFFITVFYVVYSYKKSRGSLDDSQILSGTDT